MIDRRFLPCPTRLTGCHSVGSVIAMLAVVMMLDLGLLRADDGRARRLAVVVGNNEYRPNQGLDLLGQAVNDARKLSETLRGVGFTVIEMTHDAAKEPGKTILAPNADYIRDQIDAVLDSPNLGADDVVLISLHGHGVQYDFEEVVTKEGKTETKKSARFYFCPADAALIDRQGEKLKRANDITERNHLLALDELYEKLEGCKAATKLLIVDACRNDPSRPGNARDIASVTLPKLPPPPGGIAAFFSCKANQRALEDTELGQGVFTHFLIQGLQGKADQPLESAPADGIVTFSELTSYVSNNTYNYVLKKYAGAKQSPDMRGEFDTTLPLVRLPKDKPLLNEITSTISGIKLVLIPAGEFDMGSSAADIEKAVRLVPGMKAEYAADEQPQHRVKISTAFYLGKHEVTLGQFRKFVNDEGYKTDAETDGKGGWGFDETNGKFLGQDAKFSWRNPGFTQTDEHPVVNVSWNDAQRFCSWLSRKEGKSYRLPTEAEWEYAARAATKTLYSSGDDPETVAKIGNIADATLKAKLSTATAISARDGYVVTAPVGRFAPNAFGLFDMTGNVWEWCDDVYDEQAYGKRNGITTDPKVTSGSEYRVLRGGSWVSNPRNARSATRSRNTPDDRNDRNGFRVVVSGIGVRTP